MPTYSFGNQSGTGDRPTAHTDVSVRYNSTLPNPRAASARAPPRPGRAGHVYLVGSGASRTIRARVGDSDGSDTVVSNSDSIGAGTDPSPRDLTFTGSGKAFNSGTSALRFVLEFSGQTFFDRNSVGPGSVVDSYGTVYDGSLAGYFTWYQAPSVPRNFAVTPNSDGTAATVEFDAPSDNGGSAVSGYSVQLATNAAFTTGVRTVAAVNGTVVTGLVPGARYYWRVCAANSVTNVAPTDPVGGPWSTVVSVTQPNSALGRINIGGTFVPADGRIQSGGALVPVAGKVRAADNSAWVDLGS